MARQPHHLILLVAALVLLCWSESCLAYLHPTLGRFVSRDPAGYVDGMNAYQYVQSRPLDATDESGEKLCFKEGSGKSDIQRVDKYVKILVPNATLDGDNCYCCDQGGSLPAELVKSLVDHKATVWIRPSGQPMYWDGTKTIDFGDFKWEGWFSTASGWEGPHIRRKYPEDDKERAAVLGHEMIHAYYNLKGPLLSSSVQEHHIINLSEGSGLTPGWYNLVQGDIREEEFYTVGLTNVAGYDVKANTFSLTSYTAQYTENKVRQALGVKYFRSVYNFKMPQATSKAAKDFKTTVTQKTR